MQNESWGETLLGQPTPVRVTDPFLAQGRAHSPSRSRLPSSQQHLLSRDAPRTISPNLSPKITATRQLAAPGASSHSIASSPVEPFVASSMSERSRLSALQEAHRAHGRSSPRQQPGSVSPSNLSFQPSPGSAFRPVVHSETVNSVLGQSSVAVDFAGVQTTTTDSAFTVRAVASTNTPAGAHGGAPGGIGKLTTIGLGLVTLTLLAASGHALSSAASSSDALVASEPAGRSLLSSSSGLSSTTPFGYDPAICNEPYHPSDDATGHALRVFSWSGCAFACLALFPQFMFNDNFFKSTRGLSFISVAIVMVGNVAWILFNTLPTHNDLLDNPHSLPPNDSGNNEGNFYRDQIALPLLIAHGFTFLQLWVLVVQRAKYNAAPRGKI
jgi:hypothetical protein